MNLDVEMTSWRIQREEARQKFLRSITTNTNLVDQHVSFREVELIDHFLATLQELHDEQL